MKEFRFVGGHAEELEDGRPLNPGDYTGPINERAPKNKQLIGDNTLIEVPDGTAEEVRKINEASMAEQKNASDDDDFEPVAPYGVPPAPEEKQKQPVATTARSSSGSSDEGKGS